MLLGLFNLAHVKRYTNPTLKLLKKERQHLARKPRPNSWGPGQIVSDGEFVQNRVG